MHENKCHYVNSLQWIMNDMKSSINKRLLKIFIFQAHVNERFSSVAKHYEKESILIKIY